MHSSGDVNTPVSCLWGDGQLWTEYPIPPPRQSCELQDELDYLMSFPKEIFDETKWVISIYFDSIFGGAENELLGRYIFATILVFWTIVGIPYGEQKVVHPE